MHVNTFRVRRPEEVVDPWAADLKSLGASFDAPPEPAIVADSSEEEDSTKLFKLRRRLLEKKAKHASGAGDRMMFELQLKELQAEERSTVGSTAALGAGASDVEQGALQARAALKHSAAGASGRRDPAPRLLPRPEAVVVALLLPRFLA